MRRSEIKAAGLVFTVLALVGCDAQPAATAPVAPPEAPAAQAGVAAQPVMMGGEADLDACGGLGKVKAGVTAVVRSSPNASGTEADRLAAESSVWMCDESGAWTGVAYEATGAAGACQAVSSTSAQRVPVPAGCMSGWVLSEEIELVAG